MTSCDPFIKDLDAYRDAVLETQRYREVETHLQQCAACRGRLQQDAALELQIRNAAAAWKPSADLWQRVKSSAAQAPSQSARPPWPAGIAATLVLGIVAVLAYLSFEPAREAGSDSTAVALVNEFHTFVVSRRELDYSEPGPSNVRDWFGSKVDFRVPLPVSTPDVALAGGRLCNMFDQRIVSFMYRVDGAWVSLYIMQSKIERPAGGQRLVNGYAYVEWQDQGLSYSLVGNLPAERLRGIAESLAREQTVERGVEIPQPKHPAVWSAYRVPAGLYRRHWS